MKVEGRGGGGAGNKVKGFFFGRYRRGRVCLLPHL